MSAIPEVPFDVWFGNVNYDALSAKVKLDLTYFSDVKLLKTDRDFSNKAPQYELFRAFMEILAMEFSDTDNLLWPEGIELDLSNVLFIEDRDNNIIMEFTLKDEFIPSEILSTLGDKSLAVSVNLAKQRPSIAEDGASLMGVLCTSVFEQAIQNNGVMKISLENNPDIYISPYIEDTKHEMYKISVESFSRDMKTDNLVSYLLAYKINKYLPGLIRGDMLTCIRGNYQLKKDDKIVSEYIGLEIAGLKIMIIVPYEEVKFTDQENEQTISG